MNETFRGPDSSPNCASCPCAQGGLPQRPIRGAGSLNSLAIVGASPTLEDQAQGWPLVGPSGKLLQQALASAGIDRHSIWLTNSILCQRPYSEEKLKLAVDCCRPRLAHELKLVSPSAVLALGETAAQALNLPVQALKSARGTLQISEFTAIAPVITTIHPSTILKGGGAGPQGRPQGSVSSGKNKMNVDAQYVFLESDTAKAYSLAVNPSQPRWDDAIELITEPSDIAIATIAHFADNASLLSIDLEWGKDDRITWLGLATAERAYSIYLPHMDALMRAVLRRVGERTVSKLFHNLQADVPIWESQIGPLAGIYEDTMLMHHAAFPGAAHDLQNVASQFLLVPPWKADRKKEEKQSAKDSATKLKALRKTAKQIDHENHNEETSRLAKERKAKRQAKHTSANLTAHILKLIGG